MYMDGSFEQIQKFDPEIAALTTEEEERQLHTLCLIASENYASLLAIGMEGTVWANKNAEGYPGRRFAGGCQLADKIEQLAVQRCKELFGCEYANVQSMSSTLSNIAVLRALLKPGDTILSMELNQGGHLSHGAKFHYSGKNYKVVQYGLNKETETIDMEQVESLAREYRPQLIICGTSSYPRKVDYQRFGQIARETGAYLMADIAHPVGLIAGGVIPSPVPYADVVTTSTHKTFRGPRGCGIIMCREALGKKIDQQVFPGMQGAPKMDMIASRAVLFKECMTPEYRAYQQMVAKNAQALADELKKCGLRLVSDGTETHLVLVDVRELIPTGRQAEEVLGSVGIVVNKNMIPYDPQPANQASGIRIGSPALTTRGFKEDDIREVARLLAETLKHRDNPAVLSEIAIKVKTKAERYPMFAKEWIPA
ncbi:MAG: serine hydroxymethyltransferase [Blautia sp.]